MNQVLGNRRAAAMLLAPALLLYTAIILVPIFWSGAYTLFTGSPITGFKFSGLKNFGDFVHDKAAWQATWFTVRYALIVTTAQVALGYGMALLYVFTLRRASSFIRTMVFFPVVLPTVAVALLFQKLFETAPTLGPVNSAIDAAGGQPIAWFNAQHAFWIIIILDVWRSIGFYAVLLYAGLLDIPDEVLESARMDGATGWRMLRHIVLPLSAPVLLSSIIFSINGTLKVFDSVIALTNGGPGNATTPLTLYMFQTAFSYGEYGYGSTIAMMLTILCLVVTLVVFRGSRRDRTIG